MQQALRRSPPFGKKGEEGAGEFPPKRVLKTERMTSEGPRPEGELNGESW